MKRFLLLFSGFSLFLFAAAFSQPIIIDHNCTKLFDVPDEFIQKAKIQFKIAYGHTSHGSQIISGITLLRDKEGSIYLFNKGAGTLDIKDGTPSGDLGNPDRSTWAQLTRDLLNTKSNDRNVIMWSWCGQVDGTEEEINDYLQLMNKLEADFPNIRFIYMTGHLTGTGESGNVHKRNNQIREYCKKNNKILFDFADIESYDPDGNYFLDKEANDNCDYNGGNWAVEWCEQHPGECSECSCAHSQCLNCQQKGKAFWWLMARMAGWQGITDAEGDSQAIDIENFTIQPNPAGSNINIKIFLHLDMNITLSLFDVTGCEIKNLIDNVILQKGISDLNFDTGQLQSGVYECRLITSNRAKSIKFICIK